MIAFAAKQINECQPCNDYRELFQLTIMLLGGTPLAGVKFNKLGAYHRAWQNKYVQSKFLCLGNNFKYLYKKRFERNLLFLHNSLH